MLCQHSQFLMHKQGRVLGGLFWLLVFSFLVSACGSPYEDERHETPFEYYLYVPDNYVPGGDFYLFVALHGQDQDGADCYNQWRRYAQDVRFLLLCPTMPLEDESYDVAQAEIQLAAILSDIYSRYTLANKFYLAGYDAGADFALPYAYRYPSAIVGIAVIEPNQLPSTAFAVNIPTLLLIGEEVSEQRQAAETFNDVLQNAGYTIRLIVVSGLEASLQADARRMSVELYRDLTY